MDTPVKQQIIDTTRMLLADGFLDGHVAMRCRSDAEKFLMAKARHPGPMYKNSLKDVEFYTRTMSVPIHYLCDCPSQKIARERHSNISREECFGDKFGFYAMLPSRQQQQQQPKHQQHLMTQGAAMAYPQPMWKAALQLQIIKQIEFYLGDTNLPYDSYLLNQMERLAIKATPSSPPTTNSQQEVKESAKTGRAWLPLDLIIKFKRMQMILSPLENNTDLRRQAVAQALQGSKILELSQDGFYIRRRFHFPKLSANPTTPSSALPSLPVQ
eukprot:jgi/Bigna1/144730/aug1.90_g19438